MPEVDDFPFYTHQLCVSCGGAYTQGFEMLQHPELLMLGIPANACNHYFWTAYHAIRSGFVFKHGQMLHGWLGVQHPIAVVQTVPEMILTGLAPKAALELYDSKYNPLQLVWGDKWGKFPWDEGYSLNSLVLGKFEFRENIDIDEFLNSLKPMESDRP